jgi:beta-mannosidase
MTRRLINPGDNCWRFGQVPPRPFTGADTNDISLVSEWLPASVPGNVHTDLLALGRISEPFFGQDYRESLWVESADWWYRCEIEVEPPDPDQRVFLIFEGIDYLSAIWVNRQEVTRHEGMFSRQVVEISEALRLGQGRAEVAVRLWGSTALPGRRLEWWQAGWQAIAKKLHQSWTGVYPDRSATLKCQMSFGWDFAPSIRTMGIWDGTQCLTTGSVFIAEARVRATPCQPLVPLGATDVPTDFNLVLALDSQTSCSVIASVQVRPANFEGEPGGPFLFPLQLPGGASRLTLRFQHPQASLWQPWDRGYPHLYHLTVVLTGPEGNVLDEVTLRTGVRVVELRQWQFVINGQDEFIRGLNWVPADSFPGRLRAADYSHLLTMARQSGANLLRVWGGGLREKQAFYDQCDELGLLVWQEFPFACMFLGAYPRDRAYLERVEAECSAITRRLSSHPCLALWCGGNEFSRQRNRPLLDTLATLVRRYDPTTPFIPTSPSQAHGGDAHNWRVWHGYAPIRAYQAETARFLSEFGLQALPHLDTLTAALPDPTNPQTWPTHHADLKKLSRYQLTMNNYQLPISNYQSPITNLQSLISSSQRAQAVALQTAIEHMRRRKGEAGGVCLWQFNEPWPAISWAVIDYFGRPKLAYERLAMWYNPVLVSLKFPVGRRWQATETFIAEIWAINDRLESFAGCTLQVELGAQEIQTYSLDLPANSARPVGWLRYPLATPPRLIRLNLRRGAELLSRNVYDLDWFDEASDNLFQRWRRWLAEWALW